MAPKKKTTAAKPEFVTATQFNDFKESIESSMGSLVDFLKTQATQSVQSVIVANETPMDREVRKASPDVNPVNPAWREKAEEILGEKLERCEVLFPKNGGNLFTVVIKREFSNAGEQYLQFNKEDRRTKEIGNEGLDGVEQWCKLVSSNLSRPRVTN